MVAILRALLVGVGVGVVFALFRQPIPAPPTLAGVAGIVGITFGYWMVAR